jgi:uncharacterized membrane protein YcgQ (UPF0703/DUF1980 family)
MMSFVNFLAEFSGVKTLIRLLMALRWPLLCYAGWCLVNIVYFVHPSLVMLRDICHGTVRRYNLEKRLHSFWLREHESELKD